jgi:hypothetical protein
MLIIINFASKDLKSLLFMKYALSKENIFSIERCSELRKLSQEKIKIINEWYNLSKIIIGLKIDTLIRIKLIKRLFYIWRKCFVEFLWDIQAIDIIEHFIDLKSNAKSMKETLLKYTAQKRKFVNNIFSTMKDADIIVRRSNAWEAWTKFSLKKKRSTQLRMIHNFIPINSHIIKSQYLIHRLKKMIDILIKLKFTVYFISDAINDYWKISMRIMNINKTEFLTLNDQWVYLWINQELKKATHIYSQFSNLVFDSLSANEVKVRRMLTILDIRKDTTFSIYMMLGPCLDDTTKGGQGW